MAIARLYCSGLIKFVATTNVDDLHCKSGLPKESLAELHGNSFVEECEKCLKQYKQSFVTRTATGLFEHHTGRYRSRKHSFFYVFFFRNLIAAKESWESLGKSIFVILILRCLKFWVPNFGCGSDFDLHELLLIPPAFRIRFSWKVLWVRWTFAGYHCELWKYLWTRSLNGRSAWCCMGSLFDSWAKR